LPLDEKTPAKRPCLAGVFVFRSRPRAVTPSVRLSRPEDFIMADFSPRESLNPHPTRLSDEIAGLRKTIERIDHAQDALLVNGKSLQSQIETLSGLVTHIIQTLTAGRREQEGPSLVDAPHRGRLH
jgi:hypothetical protein